MMQRTETIIGSSGFVSEAASKREKKTNTTNYRVTLIRVCFELVLVLFFFFFGRLQSGHFSCPLQRFKLSKRNEHHLSLAAEACFLCAAAVSLLCVKRRRQLSFLLREKIFSSLIFD